MNFLVGRMLSVLVKVEAEENIFWMLVYIMSNHKWRDVLLGNERINALKSMLNQRILEHFLRLGVNDLLMIFGSYYMTLLSYNTELDMFKRVLTLFLLDGFSFLDNFIIQLVSINYKNIIRIGEIGGIFEFFKSSIFEDFEDLR
jgi:hypothetical protein